MKKIGCFLLFCICVFSIQVKALSAPEVSAKSAIVIDAETKRVLYEKDAYTERGMASTTKIMTALVAIQSLDLSDIVTVSPYASGVEGSSIWLEPGEKISVEDLLYGLMLASGNDAATALAEKVSGSEKAFTVVMNTVAKKLGAYNTNFTNPHGLPDSNHYTTAFDLALISANAMENDLFAKIVGTKTQTISWENSQWDRSLSNHNKLLSRYEYCTGIKTGFTKKDGRCLVTSAEKDGRRFIAVTLSAPDDWNDHIAMLDYCFEQYPAYTVCTESEKAGDFVGDDKNAEKIELLYEKDYITALTSNEIKNLTVKKSFDVKYPVQKGQVVGRCDIYYLNNQVGSVNLIAGNDAIVRKTLWSVIIKITKGIMRL